MKSARQRRNEMIACPACGWRQPWYAASCEYCKTGLGDAGAADAPGEEPTAPERETAGGTGESAGPEARDRVTASSRATQGFPNDAERAGGKGAPQAADPSRRGRALAWWRGHVLSVPEDVDAIELCGRAVLYAGLVWVGIQSLAMPIETGALAASKLHLIHLVFHEAGHVIFRLFGELMAVAGGTLMQLLMPALFLVAFVVKYRNGFGGAVTLWWLGHSAVDIAPYAYDARAQKLMLLGGVTGRDVPGYHDWHNLLGRLGWLSRDHAIARGFYWAGGVLIALALIWGGILLWGQWQQWRLGPAYLRPKEPQDNLEKSGEPQ